MKNGILLWTVGIIIMIYSVIEIIGYVFYSKDNANYNDEEGETKLLIPEETEDEKIIQYLYVFTKDFIDRHSSKQIIERCEIRNQFVHQ